MAIIRGMKIRALQMQHPELEDVTVMAEVRGYFKEHGRTTGHKIRLQGEHFDRCLRFEEIRQLTGMESDE